MPGWRKAESAGASRPASLRRGQLTRRGFLVSVTLIGCGGLAACGSAPNEPAASATVKMTSANRYDPETVTIKNGETIQWQNTTSSAHTATFNPAAGSPLVAPNVSLPEGVATFDSGDVEPGKTWSHTFTTPGTYKYLCIRHASLGELGTVMVS
jgi:plastocyanin